MNGDVESCTTAAGVGGCVAQTNQLVPRVSSHPLLFCT